MCSIFITQEILDEIISHCREVYPREACGILAGENNVVQKVYKITNIEESGVSYLMDSMEQFNAMREIREQGLELTAIYHSHPHAGAYPSSKDVRLAFYENSCYVIVSLIHGEPEMKAFAIKEGMVKEVEIVT